MEFYNATGIDVDGRKQQLEQAMGFFENNISKLVTFSKAIPGFKNLTLGDQAKLIKGKFRVVLNIKTKACCLKHMGA